MIKEEWNLILIILTYIFLELCIVTELAKMLFLLILLDYLATYFAFSGISIALHCMCGDVSGLYNDLAVGAEHGLIVLIITLDLWILELLPAWKFLCLWRSPLLRSLSLLPYSSSLWLSGYIADKFTTRFLPILLKTFAVWGLSPIMLVCDSKSFRRSRSTEEESLKLSIMSCFSYSIRAIFWFK